MVNEKKTDWKQLVRQRLCTLKLPHEVTEDVVAELAAHLQEAYETASASGLSETEATAFALQQAAPGAGERWRGNGRFRTRAKCAAHGPVPSRWIESCR